MSIPYFMLRKKSRRKVLQKLCSQASFSCSMAYNSGYYYDPTHVQQYTGVTYYNPPGCESGQQYTPPPGRPYHHKRNFQERQPRQPRQPLSPELFEKKQKLLDEGYQSFLRECCLDKKDLQDLFNSNAVQKTTDDSEFVRVDLETRNSANVISTSSEVGNVYKHMFLKNRKFRNEVVEYYKDLGIDWVDIVNLNQLDWKIFLFKNNHASRGTKRERVSAYDAPSNKTQRYSED